MTVAAVILAADPADALADADGTPACRRLADAARAGGATPVVVRVADPDGTVAAALATADASCRPAAPGRGGIAALAADLGAEGSPPAALLLWPASHAWVDAETVTTLIAAHGTDRGAVLRPAYLGTPGLPVLVPFPVAAGLDLGATPDGAWAAGLDARLVETGDPGTTHDRSVPRAALPPFEAPPVPDDERERDWGLGVDPDAR